MRTPHDFSQRTSIIIGEDALERLSSAKVSVYGLGGVGASCALDLVRAGLGRIRVVDFDSVDASNLNRLATGFDFTLGMPKTEAFARLARSINPDVQVEEVTRFFSGAEAGDVVDPGSDCHADCVDSLNAKVQLIASLCRCGASFISSMGTAGRLAPERLRMGSFWKSSGCPLARDVRSRLRRLGIVDDFAAVWSDEPPAKPVEPDALEMKPAGAATGGRRRMVQGSSPFVPQCAGHFMASWILRFLLERMADPGAHLGS
ncbi:MAG TPA: tRNA threonylcarbamoyladenosine dehydratase [Rectinemataceae bacterium]